jgi:hypothetical protein
MVVQLVPAIALSICVLAPHSGDAQGSDSLPAGWGKSGNRPTEYAATVDHAVYRSGRSSGQLRSLVATASGTGVLAQGIRADSLRGARIRVAAWLRARDVHEVRFFARVDGPGTVLDFGNADGDPLTGTADWKLREIVIDVPNDAIGVTFGIVIAGNGTAWIDDIMVSSVPKDTPRTGTAPARETASAEMERMMRERYASKPALPQNVGFEERVGRP